RVGVVVDEVPALHEPAGEVGVVELHPAVDDGQDHRVVAGDGVPGVGQVHRLEVAALRREGGVVGHGVGVPDRVGADVADERGAVELGLDLGGGLAAGRHLDVAQIAGGLLDLAAGGRDGAADGGVRRTGVEPDQPPVGRGR